MSEQHQSVEEEKEMSFVEHLDELRMHLIRMSIAIGIFAVFAFFATELIFKEILLGPLQDHFLTYRKNTIIIRMPLYLIKHVKY